MPVFIREIVSEVLLEGKPQEDTDPKQAPAPVAIDIDDIVRRSAERVLETLRREWER